MSCVNSLVIITIILITIIDIISAVVYLSSLRVAIACLLHDNIAVHSIRITMKVIPITTDTIAFAIVVVIIGFICITIIPRRSHDRRATFHRTTILMIVVTGGFRCVTSIFLLRGSI